MVTEIFCYYFTLQIRVAQNAKVLNFFAPYPFSGAKLQVFLKNGQKNDVD